MIPATAYLAVRWLATTDVIPAGPEPFHLPKVEYYAELMAADPGEGHLAPPLVNDADGRGRYTIRDGKHRWAAHVVLGRERIRCIVVLPPHRPVAEP